MDAIVPIDDFRGEPWASCGCLFFSRRHALNTVRERWGTELEAMGDTPEHFLARTTREVKLDDPDGRKAAENQAKKSGRKLADLLREFTHDEP